MRIPGAPDAPVPPPAPDTYVVTVNGGTGSGNYEEGALVTIKANDPGNDMMFDKWTYDAPITLDYDDEVDPNTFRMIPQEVVITANFKEKPPEITPAWLLYGYVGESDEETEKTLGSLADSWSDSPTVLLEFAIVFSVPNASLTSVTFYPSGTSGRTLKQTASGRDKFGRAYFGFVSNSATSIPSAYISGVYEGQTYKQEFKVDSLF